MLTALVGGMSGGPIGLLTAGTGAGGCWVLPRPGAATGCPLGREPAPKGGRNPPRPAFAPNGPAGRGAGPERPLDAPFGAAVLKPEAKPVAPLAGCWTSGRLGGRVPPSCAAGCGRCGRVAWVACPCNTAHAGNSLPQSKHPAADLKCGTCPLLARLLGIQDATMLLQDQDRWRAHICSASGTILQGLLLLLLLLGWALNRPERWLAVHP